MKKKIILDIIMFVIMILLMNLLFTGIVLHEILGIVVFILFFIHKGLNFKWIKNITNNIFKENNYNKMIKWRYFIDILLLIDIVFIIISGIIISQVLFVNIFTATTAWSNWHHFASALGLLLIIIHGLLHYKELKIYFKKKIEENKENKFKVFMYYVILITIIILPIKLILSETFIKYITSPFTKQSNDINNTTNTQNTPSKATITLEEYLSNLHCNGCSRHCPLLALRCSRGQAYLEQAKTAYNNEYAIAANIEIGDYTVTLN